MNVKPSESSPEPGYPDRREYLRQRQVLGAAALGAGLLLSACNPPRTAGVPVQPHRLPGDIAVVPQPDHPDKDAPPRTPGVPPPPR